MTACPSSRSLPHLRRRLLAWFDRHRRQMPWRGRAEPYAVWVSEVMLQQTRVDTVVPYFERWLERFPDVAALAAASDRDVLAAWSGLGYYSRARNLHRAARVVRDEHAGELPATAAGLAALPGIGAYTAGAVASIAFGEPAPAVDGNAVRVLSRVTGEEGPVARSAVRRRLEAAAERLVDPERPGDWNQAVMELGSLVCTPRAPRCGGCPLARWCVAHREGRAQAIPVLAKKATPRLEEMHFALVERERDGALLFVERPRDGLLGGTLTLPGGPVSVPLSRLVREQSGVRVRKARLLGSAEHQFSHRRWRMRVHACRVANGSASGPSMPAPAGVRWLPRAALEREPVSAALRKTLAAAGR